MSGGSRKRDLRDGLQMSGGKENILWGGLKTEDNEKRVTGNCGGRGHAHGEQNKEQLTPQAEMKADYLFAFPSSAKCPLLTVS